MNAQYKLTAGEPLRGNAAPGPIDHAHLARFTLGNRMLESEVLQLFAGHLPVTLSELRSAASLRDWQMAAHSLKGSARAVGAWRLAQLAEEAERMPDSVSPDARRSVVARVEAAAAEAGQYIGGLYPAG